jgi:hypothetical protein
MREMLIGVVLGTLTSLIVSWIFYWLATRDLKKETAKLRQLHEMTLYALFNRDAKLEPRRDKHGNIVGIFVSAVGRA